jgi:dihydrofolate synthase/folylpolyglutamate synthase
MSKNGWWWKHDRLLLENLPYPGFRGKRQLDNLAGVLMCVTALGKVLPVSPDFIRDAIPQLHLPGRYQKIEGEPQLVLDVAHNPESVALLAENLQADPVAGKTHAVVAMLRDKDIGKSLVHMIPLVDVWYTAGLSAGRGESAKKISEIIAVLNPDSHIIDRECPESAFDLAYRQAKNSDRVVVFGSFHTVGAIIEHLSIDQQRLASPG